ncbi:MAG TPA: ATP-binding protein, partial [Burkholderiaceae bacterium]|nr:ATP-binding protein [Burkholderiaceae bacterium]
GRGYRFTVVPEGTRAAAVATAPTLVQDRSQGNLPESTSALYGRDQDLAALLTLLGSHRLVTLTGAGGVGKSTLALAIDIDVCLIYSGREGCKYLVGAV